MVPSNSSQENDPDAVPGRGQRLPGRQIGGNVAGAVVRQAMEPGAPRQQPRQGRHHQPDGFRVRAVDGDGGGDLPFREFALHPFVGEDGHRELRKAQRAEHGRVEAVTGEHGPVGMRLGVHFRAGAGRDDAGQGVALEQFRAQAEFLAQPGDFRVVALAGRRPPGGAFARHKLQLIQVRESVEALQDPFHGDIDDQRMAQVRFRQFHARPFLLPGFGEVTGGGQDRSVGRGPFRKLGGKGGRHGLGFERERIAKTAVVGPGHHLFIACVNGIEQRGRVADRLELAREPVVFDFDLAAADHVRGQGLAVEIAKAEVEVLDPAVLEGEPLLRGIHVEQQVIEPLPRHGVDEGRELRFGEEGLVLDKVQVHPDPAFADRGGMPQVQHGKDQGRDLGRQAFSGELEDAAEFFPEGINGVEQGGGAAAAQIGRVGGGRDGDLLGAQDRVDGEDHPQAGIRSGGRRCDHRVGRERGEQAPELSSGVLGQTVGRGQTGHMNHGNNPFLEKRVR